MGAEPTAAEIWPVSEDYPLFHEDPSMALSLDITDVNSPDRQANPLNPLEAILPRHQIDQFVHLFFDYIYCLTPCVHPPSIWRDLEARREERHGEEEWTHMILSLIASTLAQLPKAVSGMSSEQCVSIITQCWTSVTGYLRMDAEKSTVDRSKYLPLCWFYATANRRHPLFVCTTKEPDNTLMATVWRE